MAIAERGRVVRLCVERVASINGAERVVAVMPIASRPIGSASVRK